MKKKLLLVVLLMFSVFYHVSADNKISPPEQNWDNENERSLLFVPQLTIDEYYLYISSKIQLSNLVVKICDSYGNIVYLDNLSIPTDGTEMISIVSFNKGEYILYIEIEDKSLISTIVIN